MMLSAMVHSVLFQVVSNAGFLVVKIMLHSIFSMVETQVFSSKFGLQSIVS